tara:strand:- start:74 stop:436 length:363 start_codon:yes stop_codon:yes gene_type:complete
VKRWSFVIPFPPTQNTYYRRVGKTVKISKKGRDYRKDVISALMEQGLDGEKVKGRLDVSIVFVPPCNRRRDLDNFIKAPFDAVTHAEFWCDDSQIDILKIIRCPKSKVGYLEFEIKEVGE